ncbi:hypothetical protein CEUSTIGMA_g2307.t1 [Chlamydomonas eustigma]|uniref:Uncharacterized protein n=1 Tax=Chlamydomonas eustigma TaxID=1157962 RepID=A0A250WVL5_9CHLO|nr:hypothetical protein CEUSTIGMA_g2307.t1 [Chlamydomonas eustigma]|eukprot:GAX74861.1 hypothetical protein CEUSTIGMA_g2307.t1 [Chlamydomonas eustigma]
MKATSTNTGHVVVYKEVEDDNGWSKVDTQGSGDEGLFGIDRLKERKRRTLAAQDDEKRRPKNRPGRNADGKSDGTLGLADIATRLMPYNSGVRPTDTEILLVLKESPTNHLGRVQAAEWDTILALWISRPGAKSGDHASMHLPLTPMRDDHDQVGGKCCCIS